MRARSQASPHHACEDPGCEHPEQAERAEHEQPIDLTVAAGLPKALQRASASFAYVTQGIARHVA